jgi:hypothetical protein
MSHIIFIFILFIATIPLMYFMALYRGKPENKEAFENLNTAWDNFLTEVFKATKMDKIVEWLSIQIDKIEKKWKN